MKRIIAALLACLLLAFMGCISLASIRYSDADRYTAGNFTYDGSKVTAVEIDWVSGSITLKNGKGTLSVSETSEKQLSEEDQMHWWIDGTTLRIRYCKSGKKINLVGDLLEKKDLTVELPAFADLSIDVAAGKIVAEDMLDVGTFKVNTASGGASIGFLSAKEVDIDTASGAWEFGMVSVSGEFDVDTASGGLSVDEITANSVEVDSASGGVSIGAVMADRVKIDSASGGIALGLRRVSRADISSTSGGIRLTLADKEGGATIRFDAVSGSFSTDLPYEKTGNTYKIGSGLADIKISVTSGGVTVE